MPDKHVTPALLCVRDLRKHFPILGGLMARPVGAVHAVDGVSFDVCRKQTLALVGESGCGKSTVARLVLRLLEPDAGSVRFDGQDILALTRSEMRSLRRRIQIVFQDPYSSLNPMAPVGRIVGEAMRTHKVVASSEVDERVAELLGQVGLDPSLRHRFPHEFSGGQRQRIGIARALALQPELVVCDEAVSALDVSIQAQIINLLSELQGELGLAYLFISHDLNVVRYLADHVAVMYLGEIVEQAPARVLFESPRHPYTQALLQANPVPDPNVKGALAVLEGDVPSPSRPPPGCRFHTRCPQAMPVCRELAPASLPLAGTDQVVACHLYADDGGS